MSTTVRVKTFPIRLGQFLKLSDIAQDGNEAKYLINSGAVTLNGLIEKRRGRQLKPGDIVEYANKQYLVLD